MCTVEKKNNIKLEAFNKIKGLYSPDSIYDMYERDEQIKKILTKLELDLKKV